MSSRPSWIVLSPASVKRLTTVALKSRGHWDRHDQWYRYLKIRGKRLTAIVEDDPGATSTGEHELAALLSKAVKGRHFLLTLAPTEPTRWTSTKEALEEAGFK